MTNYMPLVLVLDTSNKLYDSVRASIEATWALDLRLLGYTVIFYRGDPSITRTILTPDHRLVVPCSDNLPSTCKKLLLAMEYVLSEYCFPFIFRTNLSSYIDPSMFHRYCTSISPSMTSVIYSGVVGRYHPWKSLITHVRTFRLSSISSPFSSVEFASGSGFFLGSSLVSKIIHRQRLINTSYIDDVAIGHFLKSLDVFPTVQFRCDIFDAQSPSKLPNVPEECFHYRVKSINRNKDACIIRLLHHYYKRSESISSLINSSSGVTLNTAFPF